MSFMCEWCQEEYDDSLKFYVVLVDNDNVVEKGDCCPDCIAKFFTEGAEEIISMNIIKKLW